MDNTQTRGLRSGAGLTADQRPAAQYAALWASGRPDLDAFLSARGPWAEDEFTAVLCADQRCRWRVGERVPAESYLCRLMGTPPNPEAAADLIFNEFLVREQLGERPSPEEFLRRFPQYAAVIRDQIDLHRAIAEGSSESDLGTITGESSVGFTTGLYKSLRPQPVAEGGAFGDYELLGEVARGGMGIVYRAHQRSLNRVVALKMILAGQFAGPEEVRRFRAEAEAVALLDHPHILPVYEVGEAAGRHFFAMKFIDGGSLARAVPRLHGQQRDAIALLVKVCRAVHFAHQRGILHRDLKPANVLLDHDDTPYVADFGLAKWMDTDNSLTLSGTVVGTPSYIAPEQARAERPLTTAADVYSLGAILYELLTARPPFKGDSAVATLAMVQDEDPLRPSLLDKNVDRDVETIALKCLDKDPSRRYGSAAALADDLDRWLRSEPITARRAAAWERAWKWARRRPAVAALTVALWLVSGLAIIGLVGLYRKSEARRVEAESQRDEAREQRRRTRQALDDMLGDSSLAWLTTQKQLLPEQRAFLERALGYYREFAAHAGSDDEGRRLEARANYRVAHILAHLGQWSEAEAPFRQTTDLFLQLSEANPADASLRTDLTNCYMGLGSLLQGLNRFDEAEVEVRKAVAIEERLAAEKPDLVEYRKGVARTYHNLGTLLRRKGRSKEAESLYRKSLAVVEKLAAEFPKRPEYREDVARSYNNLAVLLDESERRADAEAAYRSAIAVIDRLVADHPKEPDYRMLQAGTHGNLGAFLDDDDAKTDMAQAEYRAAIAINQRLADEYPSQPIHRQTLATNHFNLANSLADSKRRAESDLAYLAAIAIQEKLVADYPSAPDYRGELASTYLNRGIELAKIKNKSEAEALDRAALALTDRLVVEFPKDKRYRYTHGLAFVRLGDLADAEENPPTALQWYSRALEAFGPIDQTTDAITRKQAGYALQGRAVALAVLHRHSEAVTEWQRLLEIYKGPKITPIRANLAESLGRAGDAAGALKLANEVAAAKDITGEVLYTCACGLAVAAGRDASDVSPCANRAVELLRLAANRGMPDPSVLVKDADFTALRERPDFFALVWDCAELPVNK